MSEGDERVIAEGWITTSEAADLIGFSAEYMRRLARKGKVKARKFLGRWVFREADLREYKQTMDALGRRKHDPHGVDHALEGE
jgi:excisionase family DNA binding protein